VKQDVRSPWWTGQAPIFGQCPGVGEGGKITSLPQLDLALASRQQVLDYFDNTWTLTEILFSSLQSEDVFYRPPYHQLRHPLIFYYAHPAVLYVNKLRVAGLLDAAVDPYFESIFEVGVDEMSWDDMSKNQMKWPELGKVTEYRRTVYRLIRDLIRNHPLMDPRSKPILQDSPAWALAMGFEHERIHLETSSVLIRELPVDLVKRPEQWPHAWKNARRGSTEASPENNWFLVPRREVSVGKPADFPTFGWDNEYGHRTEQVETFETSRYLVSNGEFLEFVRDGGYREESYWSETGWEWRRFRNTKWPTFWVLDGPEGLHQYRLRALFEVEDFDPLLPAIVNFHEAAAYCSWKARKDGFATPYRLLSENEQQSLRHCVMKETEWNSDLRYGSESHVNAHVFPGNGLGDVFGNVWQWSRDPFNPLPGFKVHPYYEDFSTPCFDGKHQMIFGGSFVSTADEASQWARFHFRPHFFQHAGFRIARSPTTHVDSTSTVTESSDERLRSFKKQFGFRTDLIHLNNAGLAPISTPSYETIRHWAERFHAEGVHCGDDYLAEVEKTRGSLSRLIGCKRQEVAFFQSTAAAISQVAFGMKLNPNDEILMWDQEYASNLYPWKAAAELAGARLRLVSSGPALETPVQRLVSEITDRTRVIAVSWVQFQSGAITDLEELTRVAREMGIWVVLDIIQGLGLFPFDFARLGVDAVCGGSHKWLASPVGVGYLAIREDRVRELRPILMGAQTYGSCDDPVDLVCSPKPDALKFEPGSKQVLEILGLGASVDLFLATGISVVQHEAQRLATRLRSGLSEAGYAIHSPHREFFP
jgi:5-histidylcysteine sulfoxide synthase